MRSSEADDDDELALRLALHKARAELGADASAKKLAAKVRAEPDAQAEWDTRRVREALHAMKFDDQQARGDGGGQRGGGAEARGGGGR